MSPVKTSTAKVIETTSDVLGVLERLSFYRIFFFCSFVGYIVLGFSGHQNNLCDLSRYLLFTILCLCLTYLVSSCEKNEKDTESPRKINLRDESRTRIKNNEQTSDQLAGGVQLKV